MTQIKHLSIKNFRAFKKQANFDFKPITILTGTNNSGKSTLIKALLFLKEAFKDSDIPRFSFNGGGHNLHSFSKTINNGETQSEEPITFGFKLENQIFGCDLYCDLICYDEINCQISIRFYLQGQYYEIVRLYPNGDGYAFFCRVDLSVINPIFNNLRKSMPDDESLLKLESVLKKSLEFPGFPSELRSCSVLEVIRILEIAMIDVPVILLDTKTEYDIKQLQKDFTENITWELFESFKPFLVEGIEIDSFIAGVYSKSGLKDFFNSIIFKAINALTEISNVLKNHNVYYIPAPSGNYERKITENKNRKYIREYLNAKVSPMDTFSFSQFVKKWLKEFEIGEDIRIETQDQFDEIKIIRNKKEYELIDMGFGMSKILSIVLSVASNACKEVGGETGLFLIEEPENHLHPKLQSKLADFFIDAKNRFGVSFIIETHSEYLIRKIQYLVMQSQSKDTSVEAQPSFPEQNETTKTPNLEELMNTSVEELYDIPENSRIESKDVIIYYLYPPDNIPENTDQVTKIGISPDGDLSQPFGIGFFDESAKLLLGLLTGEISN
jgi:AAA15 family ATPase/GTPase